VGGFAPLEPWLIVRPPMSVGRLFWVICSRSGPQLAAAGCLGARAAAGCRNGHTYA